MLSTVIGVLLIAIAAFVVLQQFFLGFATLIAAASVRDQGKPYNHQVAFSKVLYAVVPLVVAGVFLIILL